MALIPAGEFEMGDAFAEGKLNERLVHRIYLDAFYLDVYDVTNAQYAAFLNEYGKNTDDAGHELLNISGRYCLIEKAGSIYRPKAGYENHPVIEVSWYGASAYAEFYGKRLPTEAEWEKAAQGGLVRCEYAWKEDVSHDYANYAGTAGKDEWYRTAPVNSFAPNGYGLYNMVGNVQDWCADWYAPDYYAGSPKQNPQGPDSGHFRVVRGGGWYVTDPQHLSLASRSGRPPLDTLTYVGFRCASTP
jgi:formylglycine-generating enzyme required for sulfatase activity